MRAARKLIAIVEYDDGWHTVVTQLKGGKQIESGQMSKIDAANYVCLLLDAGMVNWDTEDTLEIDLKDVV